MTASGDVGHRVRGAYARLMARARGDVNDDSLARMVASRAGGGAGLAPSLGLPPRAFGELLRFHFPGAGPPVDARAREPDPERAEEIEELRRLLLAHRAGRSPSEESIAEIVARACLGPDHLWRDLGLWSRRDLTALLAANFPALVARNEHDMKWKKFLYKELCEREGGRLCRAPTCEFCASYADCHGPED